MKNKKKKEKNYVFPKLNNPQSPLFPSLKTKNKIINQNYQTKQYILKLERKTNKT